MALPRQRLLGRLPTILTCMAPPTRSSCMSAWRLHRLGCRALETALAWRRQQGRRSSPCALKGSCPRLHAATAASGCAQMILLLQSLPWLLLALRQAAQRGPAASGAPSGLPSRLTKPPL